MERTYWHTAIRVLLPSLMGALGALVMAMAPVYHRAFCSGDLIHIVPALP